MSEDSGSLIKRTSNQTELLIGIPVDVGYFVEVAFDW